MKNNTETKIWNATLYLRLSRDDGDKEESNSITGQRELLRDFIRNRPELREYAVRIDDGFTGSNFERPDFKKMMEDVKEGRTNCIIVKDLSRFGRNYLDAGEYIEKIFPFLGVRFIAVNDNYDSLGEKSASDDLVIPFKNLINEAYCRDISVKVRTQLEIKRKSGQYIGAFAVYGYMKDDTDKNRLVVDEYAADIVRDIFAWKLDGMSPQDIAIRLNQSGILSPMEYKKSLGMKFATSFKANAQAAWSANSVLRILKNPVYIGVLTQGKETTPSYKVRKRIIKPEDEWAVIPDSHEPIVRREDFETVQKVLTLDTRRSPDDSSVQLFSGMVFCGECGASMVRKTVPSGNKKYGTKYCSDSPTIEEPALQKAILTALNTAMSGKEILIQTITDAMMQELVPIRGEQMSISAINARLAELESEFGQLLPLASECGSDAYKERFQDILAEMTALKEKRVWLENQLRSSKEANQKIDAARQIMEQSSADLTEWDETTIRQLVETVKVLSADEIEVHIKGGIRIQQRFER